jgi:hypothetical protein
VWTVTLYNQHAMASAAAKGRTTRQAFERALHNAGGAFLYCGAREFGRPHDWESAFQHVRAAISHQRTTRVSLASPTGFTVEIERG